jgi:asparagine synthase (glutamine-hydrolysing)
MLRHGKRNADARVCWRQQAANRCSKRAGLQSGREQATAAPVRRASARSRGERQVCGIAGIFQLQGRPVPQLRPALRVMNDLQRHRGPDGVGSWTHRRGHVGLAHRRLSIIDLSTGANQPMTDSAGNWISFNGEIYNYLELRRELGPERFRTQSDTEVILLAYQRWGEDCVHHLRGMFAFLLWDEARQRLFCARDRFGIKPL